MASDGTRWLGPCIIKGGAVITVDPNIGTLPKADVLVRDGAIAEIGSDLNEKDIEIIDAADMIVMPGFVDSALSYVEHPGTELPFRSWV